MTDDEMREECLKIVMYAFSVLIKTQPRLTESDWHIVHLATTLVSMELFSIQKESIYEH